MGYLLIESTQKEKILIKSTNKETSMILFLGNTIEFKIPVFRPLCTLTVTMHTNSKIDASLTESVHL